MARPRLRAGGGLASVAYVLRKGREAGGLGRLYRRLRSRNACKTCALGMGGQQGGMVNEAGHFPEVCKKSVQAQAADMATPITEAVLAATPIARLERLGSAGLERLGRLAFPIVAQDGDTHFRRVAWAEALDRAGAALRAAPPAEVFFYSSGRASNEAAFLMQLVARAYGTANIHNCSFYCHNASSVALGQVYGSGTASVGLEDLAGADLALVAGANPASNHPRLVAQLVALRRRGGSVIVVNPLRELGLVRFRLPSDWRSLAFGSVVSDLYLQPHVGGDVPLFVALLKGLVEAGGVDRDYLAAHTAGWEAVERAAAAVVWDDLLARCGVPRGEIERAVGLLAAARRGVCMWAMGLTHHAHGVDNVLALANLALARGWVGRPGAGLLPIRGHSNVQGVGTCGVTPALKQAFAAQLAARYGITAGLGPGLDTFSSMAAAAEGRVRACVLLGGNLFASNPDRSWAAAALRRIGTTIAITTKLNEGHLHGRGRTTIILPVLARDEEQQATTQESMFNFVRLSEGRHPAVSGEMRSEVEVIAALAELVLPPGRFDWSALRSHRHLRGEIARVVPGMAALATIDETRREFTIAGRTFSEPRFPTPDGRARLHVTPLPDFAPGPDEFRLMTLRSEGQFNTVVYEEEDVYRGNTRRDVVMMAAADAARLGLVEGDRVTVETEAGSLEVSATITDLRAGNLAMYYPEANALVPRRLDPRARTPAFKSVAARLRRVAAATAVLLVLAQGAAAHDVPIDPSTCAFDPVIVTPPEAAPIAAVPAGAADQLRIVWDVATSGGQLDLTAAPPRALAGGAGTLALPALFQARLTAAGDLTTPPLTLVLAPTDAPPLGIRTSLTTGLAGERGALVAGEPLGAAGRFTLVGRDPASGYAVSLTCQPLPVPDLDQFQSAPHALPAAGRLGTHCRRGACGPRGRVRTTVAGINGIDCSRPFRLRLGLGGESVATADLVGGLTPSGRGCTGTSDYGGTLTVRRIGRSTRHVLSAGPLVREPAFGSMPDRGTLDVTWEVGGHIVHADSPFRSRAGALRLGSP